jgi:hypothetical protein
VIAFIAANVDTRAGVTRLTSFRAILAFRPPAVAFPASGTYLGRHEERNGGAGGRISGERTLCARFLRSWVRCRFVAKGAVAPPNGLT